MEKHRIRTVVRFGFHFRRSMVLDLTPLGATRLNRSLKSSYRAERKYFAAPVRAPFLIGTRHLKEGLDGIWYAEVKVWPSC
jgi:hypothetical protein